MTSPEQVVKIFPELARRPIKNRKSPSFIWKLRERMFIKALW